MAKWEIKSISPYSQNGKQNGNCLHQRVIEKDLVSPDPRTAKDILIYHLLIFRKLLRRPLMYPEKGSIQEVMGLPPRSVTKPGKPKHMKTASVAFQQQKSQLESHGQMWPADVYCLVCRIFFCNLNLNVLAGRVLFSKATSLLFPRPIHSFMLPTWPLWAFMVPTITATTSPTPHPSPLLIQLPTSFSRVHSPFPNARETGT